MKVVIDTSLSPRIARVLGAIYAPSHNVVHANDISGKNNADVDVCEYLRANTPSVFIAQDIDTYGQPHRMAALDEMKSHIVLLAPGWLGIRPDEQVWMLLKVMPRILKRLSESSGISGLHVTPGPQLHIRKLK